MFRHKNKIKKEENKKIPESAVVDEKLVENPLVKAPKDSSPEALLELLEKNLKWSQIIYEQNRRINSKLFWQALAGWFRIFIIVVPLILATVYLTPFLNEAWSQYQSLLGQVGSAPKDNNSTLEKIINLLPLDPAQQEQAKTMLK